MKQSGHTGSGIRTHHRPCYAGLRGIPQPAPYHTEGMAHAIQYQRHGHWLCISPRLEARFLGLTRPVGRARPRSRRGAARPRAERVLPVVDSSSSSPSQRAAHHVPPDRHRRMQPEAGGPDRPRAQQPRSSRHGARGPSSERGRAAARSPPERRRALSSAVRRARRLPSRQARRGREQAARAKVGLAEAERSRVGATRDVGERGDQGERRTKPQRDRRRLQRPVALWRRRCMLPSDSRPCWRRARRRRAARSTPSSIWCRRTTTGRLPSAELFATARYSVATSAPSSRKRRRARRSALCRGGGPPGGRVRLRDSIIPKKGRFSAASRLFPTPPEAGELFTKKVFIFLIWPDPSPPLPPPDR